MAIAPVHCSRYKQVGMRSKIRRQCCQEGRHNLSQDPCHLVGIRVPINLEYRVTLSYFREDLDPLSQNPTQNPSAILGHRHQQGSYLLDLKAPQLAAHSDSSQVKAISIVHDIAMHRKEVLDYLDSREAISAGLHVKFGRVSLQKQ